MPDQTTQAAPTASRTRIIFDLRDELTPEEIAQFEDNAAKAGSANLTEHFLSLTLRLQKAAIEAGFSPFSQPKEEIAR
jgi:hypothetical protein